MKSVIRKRLTIFNINEWIAENEEYFLPPVCNRLMFDGQLKVFFVGGPNSRRDYHIEEGEELFYMFKGDMKLIIMQADGPKEIIIREGEAYLLPARVPHSPQRAANTIGLVIERQRLITELDAIRFYATESGQIDGKPSAQQILIDKWFHCASLGQQLTELLKQLHTALKSYYDDSDRDKFSMATLRDNPPYEPNLMIHSKKPMIIEEWFNKHQTIGMPGGDDFLNLITSQSTIKVYGQGCHHLKTGQDDEAFIWQWTNSATIIEFDNNGTAHESKFPIGHCALIPNETWVKLINPQNDSMTFYVAMPFPKAHPDAAI